MRVRQVDSLVTCATMQFPPGVLRAEEWQEVQAQVQMVKTEAVAPGKAVRSRGTNAKEISRSRDL